jgi:hypothetical protein
MATGGIMASVGYTFYIGLVYFASSLDTIYWRRRLL